MPPKLIAHRGGSDLRVENTLAAFANAIALGADGAELDVHLSRDGEVVVHHDEALNPAYCRHAGGDWIDPDKSLALAELTYAQLCAYDIGTPRPGTEYARRHPRLVPVTRQRVPLLRDVVRLARARSDHFTLVVEIKSPPLRAAGKPWRKLVDATLAIVMQEDFAARTILCSFDWGALRYAMARQSGLATWFTSSPLSWFEPGLPPARDSPPPPQELAELRCAYATGDAPWFAGFDPRRFAGSYPRAVAAAGARAWFPYARDVTQAVCGELARLGLDSAAWSVGSLDPHELTRLVRTGVDNLVIDDPDVSLSTLANPGSDIS